MGIFEDMLNDKPIVIETKDESDDTSIFYEVAYPDSIQYMKTLTRQITLPKGNPVGKGNLCFLYTPRVLDSFALMKGAENYKNGNHYYFYYYNPTYIGTLYNKKYRFRDLDERKRYYDLLKQQVDGVHPYIKLRIEEKEKRNMYYDLSKYIDIFFSVCDKLPPLKKITLYWEYLKAIITNPNLAPAYENKFVLVNVDMYEMTKELKKNLHNPLFMIYYTLWKKADLISDLDIDFYFFTGKKNLKINPAKIEGDPKEGYRLLKQQIRKLYAAVPKEILDNATSDDEVKKQEAVDETVGKIKESISDTNVETKVIHSEEELKELSKETEAEKDIEKKVKEKANNAANEVKNVVSTLQDLPQDTITDVVTTNVENEINTDKELISSIYDNSIAKSVPKKSFSSERDRKLQEAQKDLKVGNMTIKDIEKVKAANLTIPVKDVSKSVRTTNKNMTQMKFANIEKVYTEKLMPKDITDAILSLNNKSIPMYIRKIDVKDTSDELNYKETYTIYLEDANRNRHTVKVDIPKFIEGRFLYIGGNRKVIKKQNFLYPVVKTSSDTVQIVTNYNKMFIKRTNTKSISSVERLKILLKKNDDAKSLFDFGNALFNNQSCITTVEYDELSKIALRFKANKCKLYFDQVEALELAKKKEIGIPKNKIFIGFDSKGDPCFIDEDTQKTKDGKSIVEIIVAAMPEKMVRDYEVTNTPNRLMVANVTVMSKAVAIGLLLGFWEGLESILKKANIKYRLEATLPKERKANEIAIRFLDCFLIYESDVRTDLIMNSFRLINTRDMRISEMNNQEAYMPYITKVYGRSAIANALMNVYEFMVDPITLEVLQTLNMPTDIVSLVIYAVALLADSQFTTEIDQHLSRIRGAEIIPAILYDRLAKNYITYRNSNGKKKFSVPQDCVIKELLAVKTVEDYSTLNPILELDTMHGVSTKGFRGANLDRSYDVAKRSYHESMTGTISPCTSPDANTGISKTLTMNPSIVNPRGYVQPPDSKQELNKLNDTELFSPSELMTPLTSYIDEPNRLGHSVKQGRHTIPVKNSSPVLISNGMDEVCRFQLSSDFVINADEPGEIVDYDPVSKIMIAKYRSGKCRAINLEGTIVKNSGGGFFLSNELVTNLKVGDKFKKDDVLAYHKDFFTNSKFNNCRYNLGTLAKVALMSCYDTYQDATFITEKLSEEAATEMCFQKQVTIGKNSNVEYMVKEGDEIKVGDSLIQFDTSYEDNSLNNLLASLGEREKELVLAGSRNDVPSKFSGVIERIKIYSTVDIDELSPSLRKIVRAYYNKINKKKAFLEKYDPDSKNSVFKCGILMDEGTHKVEPNKFNVLKGQKIEEGVLIEFYIKHAEPLEVGSKIANYSALKNTIGEIVPKGYEPYGSFRPDEEISTVIASNSILKRMVPTIILVTLGNKNIIELKRKLKEIYEKN